MKRSPQSWDNLGETELRNKGNKENRGGKLERKSLCLWASLPLGGLLKDKGQWPLVKMPKLNLQVQRQFSTKHIFFMPCWWASQRFPSPPTVEKQDAEVWSGPAELIHAMT